MRVLHITTVRSGSTGRTATDLKALLKQKGEDFRIAFSVQDSMPLNGDILIGNRLDHKIHAFLSRLFGLQGYFSYFATQRFLKRVNEYKPDLVQLGNLHANYINLPLLFNYLSKQRIPVVMILHDCWFFTGKCTHFTERCCEKWRVCCHHCPALKCDNESWFFDRTRKMFRDRKKWYLGIESLTVIAVSDWEKQLALKSPLFSKAKVTRVYNWIDAELFKPSSREQIEQVIKKYGLNQNVKYVLSVGANWPVNSTKSQDAIRFSNLLPSDYQLIIVGRGSKEIFPRQVIRISYTSNPEELATLYSLSHAYIHFSIEDTFGKVIAEAMSCQTVPIVFDSTACGETAGPFGISVAPHNVEAMVDALHLAEESSRREKVRIYAKEHYVYPVNLEEYWQL